MTSTHDIDSVLTCRIPNMSRKSSITVNNDKQNTNVKLSTQVDVDYQNKSDWRICVYFWNHEMDSPIFIATSCLLEFVHLISADRSYVRFIKFLEKYYCKAFRLLCFLIKRKSVFQLGNYNLAKILDRLSWNFGTVFLTRAVLGYWELGYLFIISNK